MTNSRANAIYSMIWHGEGKAASQIKRPILKILQSAENLTSEISKVTVLEFKQNNCYF